ncbi:aldolase catalytic domain-containing protein [Spirochaeta cellobiosiphila]|uniref:aldolase catalytic domain-containing protein n=1 Tax=Spirochaeta cellobiosiphila TaxID=504483 RepID=UPI0004182479|nr:aldolase catalytic domain-containing protein [Spirochaeta cellobiosiphila]
MQVIDCTIRDGGLMNKWQFDDACVREVVSAAVRSGVDYVEVGYKASTEYFDPTVYGKWRFSLEEDLADIWSSSYSNSKLSIMVDIGRFKLDMFIPQSDSLIKTFRIACYIDQVKEAIETSLYLDQLGYETFINIMAISSSSQGELKKALQLIDQTSPCKAVYVVDSFGSLSMNQTAGLIKLYKDSCPSKKIGFHGHNNQQLALANTLMAIECGAEYVDGTFYGMGRGAGNCPLELLLTQLGKTPTEIKPIASAIERHINPLRQKLRWGYHLPYALSGLLNTHPRKAMAAMLKDESVMTDEFWNVAY